jgi:hypothetical protein
MCSTFQKNKSEFSLTNLHKRTSLTARTDLNQLLFGKPKKKNDSNNGVNN